MKVSSGYVVNGDDDAVLKPIKQLADFAADILGGRYSIIDRLPFRTRLRLVCARSYSLLHQCATSHVGPPERLSWTSPSIGAAASG